MDAAQATVDGVMSAAWVAAGVDVASQQITFGVAESSSGNGSCSTVQEHYDLLIGADGINSVVRSALQQHYQDMTVVIGDSGREYKTYQGMRGDIEPEEFKVNPGATLHLWTSDDPWTTFTAHSNPDGTYSGTLSLKTGGFAELTTQQQYEQLIRNKFAGVPDDWVPAIAQQVVNEKPSSAGIGASAPPCYHFPCQSMGSQLCQPEVLLCETSQGPAVPLPGYFQRALVQPLRWWALLL
eukprot:GHRR01029642.1.p1 GENE.GHRR01029642.1~~GHRR01029642.1.p1  ORF type:complete len:239 (+),score=97.76 GHRR01029642.1:990-1706(+)